MSSSIKIVIVGNGFGGTYALKHLHKFLCNDKRVEITIIGEKNYFLFTPLLHEVATGGGDPGHIIEPTHEIFRCCIAKFHVGRAEHINLKERKVKISGVGGEETLLYDYLVLAPGSRTNFYGIPGANKFTLELKSVGDAIKIKNHIVGTAENPAGSNFIVVGGGPTGVELACELKEFLGQMKSSAEVYLIEKGDEVLTQFGPRMRKGALKILKKKGVRVLLNSRVKEVNPSGVILENGENIKSKSIFWVAGIRPNEINFEENPKKLGDGRLVVNKYLELEGKSGVFALGDAAACPEGEGFLPALAQVAEKQSKTVAKNIYFSIKKRSMAPFRYRSAGSLVSLGQWHAIGEIYGLYISGPLAWLLWRGVYLSKLISLKQKIKVALDWIIDAFLPRDISKI